MRRYLYIVILVSFIWKTASAQMQTIEVGGSGGTSTSTGFVRFIDASSIGTRPIEKVDYSDIDGSPYYDDNWSAAILVLNNNKAIQLQNVKLNLYNNEFLYKDTTGKELAAENSIVKKIFIFKGQDTSKLAAVFLSLPSTDNKSNYAYYRAWNEGQLELLQLQIITVHTSAYDPLQGKSEHKFQTKSSYYLLKDGNLSVLSGLNKSAVLAAMQPPSTTETWLSDHKNKLKNENEIAAYLVYCNSLSTK